MPDELRSIRWRYLEVRRSQEEDWGGGDIRQAYPLYQHLQSARQLLLKSWIFARCKRQFRAKSATDLKGWKHSRLNWRSYRCKDLSQFGYHRNPPKWARISLVYAREKSRVQAEELEWKHEQRLDHVSVCHARPRLSKSRPKRGSLLLPWESLDYLPSDQWWLHRDNCLLDDAARKCISAWFQSTRCNQHSWACRNDSVKAWKSKEQSYWPKDQTRRPSTYHSLAQQTIPAADQSLLGHGSETWSRLPDPIGRGPPRVKFGRCVHF